MFFITKISHFFYFFSIQLLAQRLQIIDIVKIAERDPVFNPVSVHLIPKHLQLDSDLVEQIGTPIVLRCRQAPRHAIPLDDLTTLHADQVLDADLEKVVSKIQRRLLLLPKIPVRRVLVLLATERRKRFAVKSVSIDTLVEFIVSPRLLLPRQRVHHQKVAL